MSTKNKQYNHCADERDSLEMQLAEKDAEIAEQREKFWAERSKLDRVGQALYSLGEHSHNFDIDSVCRSIAVLKSAPKGRLTGDDIFPILQREPHHFYTLATRAEWYAQELKKLLSAPASAWVSLAERKPTEKDGINGWVLGGRTNGSTPQLCRFDDLSLKDFYMPIPPLPTPAVEQDEAEAAWEKYAAGMVMDDRQEQKRLFMLGYNHKLEHDRKLVSRKEGQSRE